MYYFFLSPQNFTKGEESWAYIGFLQCNSTDGQSTYHILFTLDLHARPRKIQNIIFSPWDRENTQNDVGQPGRTSKHQLK